MQMRCSVQMFTFFANILWLSHAQEEPNPTVSPSSEFVARPRNVTVLEGYPAVLRCKMRETVHNCQWFYLERGIDMFDTGAKPILVKEFRPIKDRDCSIKFSKARSNQSGQWICKGLQISARKYVVSEPAYLRVISITDDSEVTTTKFQESGETQEEEKHPNKFAFQISDEGHIINTDIGSSTMLGCKTNKELKNCSWIKPDGTIIRSNHTENEIYAIEGNFTSGNCSLVIAEVSMHDEGNWRCVVTTLNHEGDKLGPLIHLHVFEFGHHFEGDDESHSHNSTGVSLIGILVATSVVLVIVIVALVCYMYRRGWRNGARSDNLSHKYFATACSTTSSDYRYGTTWFPDGVEGMRNQKLLEASGMCPAPAPPGSNPYTRYLDMSGTGAPKPEEYIVFPASSVRSSMSSRTTLSTVPVGPNALHDSDRSGRTSANVSLHSSSSLWKEPVERSASVDSGEGGHLYEEIDELRLRGQDEPPEYANIEEDHEGYMIPRRRSVGAPRSRPDSPLPPIPTDEQQQQQQQQQTKAPPYSKVGENGLVPDTNASQPIASNPIYSANEEPSEASDGEEPPVPLRTDSADNHLATYDVPRASDEKTCPVFV